MTVEVAVLGSPSLIVLTLSVDVKQHLNSNTDGLIRKKNESYDHPGEARRGDAV